MMDSEKFFEIIRSLRDNTRKQLELYCDNFSIEQLIFVFETLRYNKSLEDFALCNLDLNYKIDYNFCNSDDNIILNLIDTILLLKKDDSYKSKVLSSLFYKSLEENNKNIKSLCLNLNNINFEGFILLSNVFVNNYNIIDLDLMDNKIGDHELAILYDGFENLHLENLNLCRNNISSKGAQIISQFLEKNQYLKVLDLSMNLISDDGIEYISNSLLKNNILQKIRLHDNKIGNNGISSFSKMLSENTGLLFVDLHRNLIDNNGARLFFLSLIHNNSLVELNLLGNNITDEINDEFEKFRTKNKTLKYLLYKKKIYI